MMGFVDPFFSSGYTPGMKILRIAAFAALGLLEIGSAFAQQRPLVTERAELTPRGSLRLELGFEFLQDAVYTLSGLEGDLTRAGVLGLRFGVSDNVEIVVSGVIQDYLSVNNRFPAPNEDILDFTGDSTNDVGDFRLATKIRLNQGTGRAPVVGLMFGVELPNASNESGLGNDQTNAFGGVLVEKAFGKLRLMGNAGIAILGDPVESSSQKDQFTYGAAFLYEAHPKINLLAETYGRLGPDGIGTEERSRVRAGAQILAGGIYWDVAGFWGLKETDPSSGIVVGISKSFDIF